MIRAAIVGIGRWGRTLVGSVQGKSSAIRFTAGHNRTRAHAEAFCAEHGLKLADSLDRILADRAIDAVVRAGVVLGVAYPRRFHPGMRELKVRIADGRLGTIAHCHGEQNAPAGLFMMPQSW